MIGVATSSERKLFKVLNRQVNIDAVKHLVSALRGDRSDVALERTALALDTSAFLRLARHSRSADIIDYIGVGHKAPFIIPGQAVQEFWTNQMSVIDTVAIGLEKKFVALRKDIDQVEVIASEHIDLIKLSLSKLIEEHGHVYDANTNKNVIDMLVALKSRATVSFASRSVFLGLASHRKMTKTPPGFRDGGDGDFFIWIDALTGLLSHRRSDFDKFVLVTLDEKPDWSRGGTPHPILSAEVAALFDCSFEIWKPDKLADEVMKAME